MPRVSIDSSIAILTESVDSHYHTTNQTGNQTGANATTTAGGGGDQATAKEKAVSDWSQTVTCYHRL